MNTSNHEKTLKELVLGKCWEYINENFYKFNETNKIKVALALLQKSMPTVVEGEGLKGPTQIVVIRSKEEIADPTQALSRQIPVQP